MGFKRTTEGRVFFSNIEDTANDEAEYKAYESKKSETKTVKPRASAAPAGGQNSQAQHTQLQIVALLKSLNEKLKDNQVERKQMRKELDRYRTALAHLEDSAGGRYEGRAVQAEEIARDTLKELEETRALVLKLEEKSEKTDKAFSALQKLGQEQAQRSSKTATGYAQLAKRLQEQELKQEDISNRIEETVSQQARLVRKIDKAIEDRARFMRKIERIEETVIQTRDSLNAKAMVLLTDQGAAAHVALEDSEALAAPSKGDALEKAIPQAQRAAQQEAKPSRWAQVTTLMIAIVALLAGWFISEVQRPDLSGLDIFNTGKTVDELAETVIERAPAPFERTESTPEQEAQPWYVREDMDAFSESAPTVEPAAGQEDALAIDGAAEVEAIDIGQADDIGTLTLQSDEELLEAMGVAPEEVARVMNEIEPGSQQIIEQEAVQALESEIEEKYGSAPPSQEAPQEAQAFPSPDFKIDAPTGKGVASSVDTDDALPDVIKRIEAQAFDGVAEAQHDLAAVYTAGHAGVRQDFRRGAYWFQKAAEQGVPNAAYNLGVLNHQGLGMETDLNEAIRWYNQAALKNHPEAQYNLGIAFIEGIGVPYDPARAGNYFENAANQGIKEAAYNLGLIYENGLLGRAQPDEALAWYKTASDAGSPEAKAALEQLAKSLNINIEDVNAIADTVKGLQTGSQEATAFSEDQAPKKKEITEATTDVIYQSAPAVETNAAEIFEAGIEQEQMPLVATDDVYRAQEEKQILVAQIQEYLIRLGLFPGPADGAPGPLMEDAIRSYQSLNGLTVDGQASQTLLSHMLAAGGYEEFAVEEGEAGVEEGPHDLGSRAY